MKPVKTVINRKLSQRNIYHDTSVVGLYKESLGQRLQPTVISNKLRDLQDKVGTTFAVLLTDKNLSALRRISFI